MPRIPINLGTPPTGNDGDPVRTAFEKINSMTTELYSDKAKLGTAANMDVLGLISSGKSIIERGSSTSGEWIKFHDGTQIAWHSISVSGLNVAPGAAYYTGTIPFPVPFTGKRFVSFTTVGLNAGKTGIVTLISVNNAGTDAATWAVQNFVTNNGNGGNLGNYEANLLVVGRWR